MKRKLIIFPLATLATLSLTSCNFEVTEDPNKEFVDQALSYYRKLREKQNITDVNAEYHAWYYDSSLLKGVVFNSLTDYQYLGIVNFQNLCFSETENSFFMDIPNYDISFNFETGEINLPPFFENPIDFINELPLVLIRNDGKFDNDDVYTKFDENGNINDYAYSENYDPTLFYIEDFSYDFGVDALNEFDINYQGKETAILKRDIYGLIEDVICESGVELPLNLSISDILIRSYNKANNLKQGELVPKTINFPSKFDDKEVVVGPMGLTALFDTSSVKQIKNVKLNEGITTLSFFAFDGATNLSSLELPSSLKEISLSSLSNLNLDTLVVHDTENEINIVESKGLEVNFDFNFNNTDYHISVSSPFNNTTINNSLIFENYDNKNAENFPYLDINFTNGLSNSINYIDSENIDKYSSISEGFSKTSGINPLFNLAEIPSDGIISDDKLTNIETNKTLYLASSYVRDDGTLYRNNFNNYRTYGYIRDNEGTNKLTLKLENDLEVNGRVVLSGVIGSDGIYEGKIVGDYTSIDLNGHTLTIKNGGIIDSNGLIFDSSTSKSGKIIVENGGILKTNLVTNSYNYNAYNNAISENGLNISPFTEYNLPYLRANITLNNGANLIVKESSFNNQNIGFNTEINLFSNNENSVFKYENDNEGTINLSYDELNDKNNVASNLALTYNGFPIIDSQNNLVYTHNKYTYLSNNLINYTFNNDLVTNSKIIIGNNGNFEFNGATLTINNSLVNLNSDSGLYINLLENGQIVLPSDTSNIALLGRINLNDLAYSNLSTNVITKSFSFNELINVGIYDNSLLNYSGVNQYDLDLVLSSSNNELIKTTNTYSIIISNNNRTMVNSNNETLASKTNNGNWTINVDGNEILTDIDSDVITYFRNDTTQYLLTNNGTWNQTSTADENQIYHIDGSQYILYNGNLIEGHLNLEYQGVTIFTDLKANNYLLFDSNQTGNSQYYLTRVFEHGHIFALTNNVRTSSSFNPNDYLTLVYLDGQSVKTLSPENYDSNNHTILVNNQLSLILGDTGEVVDNVTLGDKLDATNDNESLYIYSYRYGWDEVNKYQNEEYYEGIDGSNSNYVYLSSGRYEKVIRFDGSTDQYPSLHGYTFYNLVDETSPLNNYAMLNEDGGVSVITKAGGLRFTRDDLESGLENLIPEGIDNFTGYRYFIKDNRYYIFVNNIDEDGNDHIEMVEITNTPIYTELILEEGEKIQVSTAFSLVSIIANTNGVNSTYYLDVSNVIAVGSSDDLEDSSYLGLATYTTSFNLDLNGITQN